MHVMALYGGFRGAGVGEIPSATVESALGRFYLLLRPFDRALALLRAAEASGTLQESIWAPLEVRYDELSAAIQEHVSARLSTVQTASALAQWESEGQVLARRAWHWTAAVDQALPRAGFSAATIALMLAGGLLVGTGTYLLFRRK